MSKPKVLEEYTVKWTIDLSSTSYREAAEEALKIQRDVDSQAVYFEVIKSKDSGYQNNEFIDLMDPEKCYNYILK